MEYHHEIITYNNDLNAKFYYNTGRASKISKHWHNSLEMIYLLEGSLEVELDNAYYLLHAEDFILIHPRRIHSTTCRYHNSAIILQIPYQFLQENIPDIENLLFTCAPADITAENADAANSIRNILKSLLKVYQEKSTGYPLKISSLLFDLLFVLYRNFSTPQNSLLLKKTEKYLARLELITSYVKNHYKQNLSLEDAAKTAGLNPQYFSRFFKKYIGITFTEYLNTIRLEHCYADLLNTDCSISEIIEKNGFRNYKLFISLFRKNYGCTPSEQRLKNHHRT